MINTLFRFNIKRQGRSHSLWLALIVAAVLPLLIFLQAQQMQRTDDQITEHVISQLNVGKPLNTLGKSYHKARGQAKRQLGKQVDALTAVDHYQQAAEQAFDNRRDYATAKSFNRNFLKLDQLLSAYQKRYGPMIEISMPQTLLETVKRLNKKQLGLEPAHSTRLPNFLDQLADWLWSPIIICCLAMLVAAPDLLDRFSRRKELLNLNLPQDWPLWLGNWLANALLLGCGLVLASVIGVLIAGKAGKADFWQARGSLNYPLLFHQRWRPLSQVLMIKLSFGAVCALIWSGLIECLLALRSRRSQLVTGICGVVLLVLLVWLDVTFI